MSCHSDFITHNSRFISCNSDEKSWNWNMWQLSFKFFIPAAETRFHNGLLVISTVTPDSLGNNSSAELVWKQVWDDRSSSFHISCALHAIFGFLRAFKETWNSKMTNICSEWMKVFRVGEECYLAFVWSGRELTRWQTNADEVSKVLLLLLQKKIIWFLCNLCVWNTADLILPGLQQTQLLPFFRSAEEPETCLMST